MGYSVRVKERADFSLDQGLLAHIRASGKLYQEEAIGLTLLCRRTAFLPDGRRSCCGSKQTHLDDIVFLL